MKNIVIAQSSVQSIVCACFVVLAFSQTATAGSYSQNCDDYQTAGFSSKDQCLKDGRWHVAYENNASGNASYGSVDILNTHLLAGADVKVIGTIQNLFSNGSQLSIIFNTNEKCQQVYRSQNGAAPIYCLTPLRFSGEATQDTAHGSVRYGTDGKLFCNGMSSPGGNGCAVDPVALKWLVKY